MRNFILLCLSVSLFPLLALAQDIKTEGKLTEASIKSFYDTNKDIHKKPYDEYLSFMQQHISEDVKIKMNSIALLDGAPPQTQEITLTKKQIIDALPDDYKSSQGAVIDQKVSKISIAPDGKSADAKSVVVITNDMDVPNQPNAKAHIQSQSLCEDSFTLNADSEPQLSASTCTTKTKITPIK